LKYDAVAVRQATGHAIVYDCSIVVVRRSRIFVEEYVVRRHLIVAATVDRVDEFLSVGQADEEQNELCQ
jgi:hypothetical protein